MASDPGPEVDTTIDLATSSLVGFRFLPVSKGQKDQRLCVLLHVVDKRSTLRPKCDGMSQTL